MALAGPVPRWRSPGPEIPSAHPVSARRPYQAAVDGERAVLVGMTSTVEAM
jgi:hypothetical protein